jgi:DNA-binding NtrC family response regulator
VDYFLERMRERLPNREWSVTREAMVSLWSYDWLGNVRELENMVERLMILCEDSVIDTPLLPPNLIAGTRLAETRIPTTIGEGGIKLNTLVRELEGRMINEALKQTGGNKQAAARLLGLKRTTFSAKLRRCGVIAPSSSNGREES